MHTRATRNVRASPKSQVAPPSGSLRVLSRKVGPLGAERLSSQARAQMIETLGGHCAPSKAGLEHGHARSEQLDGMLAATCRPWWRRWLTSQAVSCPPLLSA